MLDVEREVSAYLISITLINAGLAAAVGLAFWAIGLPTPHLWALFAFILNYIPYLGPITGLVFSAAISIVVFDSIGQALLAPLVYGALIGLETQIITPTLLSRRMQINAVMILLALAFWAWAWGIAGIVRGGADPRHLPRAVQPHRGAVRHRRIPVTTATTARKERPRSQLRSAEAVLKARIRACRRARHLPKRWLTLVALDLMRSVPKPDKSGLLLDLGPAMLPPQQAQPCLR